MTELQKELFLKAGIDKLDLEFCYISSDNILFTPVKDKDGNITKTGAELYEEYKKPPVTALTEAEKQADLINNLILDNLNMQMQIDTLIQSNL